MFMEDSYENYYQFMGNGSQPIYSCPNCDDLLQPCRKGSNALPKIALRNSRLHTCFQNCHEECERLNDMIYDEVYLHMVRVIMTKNSTVLHPRHLMS